MPSSCGDRHPITHQGQPVILACSVEHGHTGQHQAYHADRLHQWPANHLGDHHHATYP